MAPRTTTTTKAPDVDPKLVPRQPGIETWKNATPGTVAINRVGEYGKQLVDLVIGGRAFTLTPEERRMNQNVVALPEMDPFTNGTLQPVHLIEGEFDTATLRENPNAFDEVDVEAIFRIKGEAFHDRLETISNLAAITRLGELAREPRYAVTVQQYEMVKLRERALEDTVTQGPPPDASAERLPRPVTPK